MSGPAHGIWRADYPPLRNFAHSAWAADRSGARVRIDFFEEEPGEIQERWTDCAPGASGCSRPAELPAMIRLRIASAPSAAGEGSP
jgi:hypothetical protein